MQASSQQQTQPSDGEVAEYAAKILRMDKASRHRTLSIVEIKRLAQFLRNNRTLHPSPPQTSTSFAQVYELRSHTRPNRRLFSPSSNRVPNEEAVERWNRMLFLSGYPSAPLLVQIGSRFNIDPAYFDAHLSFIRHDFTSCNEHPSYYRLLSRQRTIFQTSVTSIGYAPEDSRYNNLAAKRGSFATQMDRYLSDLRTGTNWGTFQSIVRAIEVHDTRRFSLEQNVTILVQRSIEDHKRWLVAVWSDAGAGLAESPRGPWLDTGYARTSTHFRPVTLPEQDSAAMVLDHNTNGDEEEKSVELHQSVTLLAQNYGASLDPQKMAADPIYALNELFTFIAASETQYLDLIKAVLNDNVTHDKVRNSKNQLEALETLHFVYKRLENRSGKIIATIDFLTTQIKFFPGDGHSSTALIIRDYEYLRRELTQLMAQCDHEWTVITSEAAVEDAQWSRGQSRIQYKFTVLATVYVPISFSCSLFGMTFFDLDSIRQGFTIWSFVTAPLFVLSLTLLFWDGEYMRTLWKRIRSINNENKGGRSEDG